ncbi:MAG: hypothetical protein K0R24_1670 [Gammaproteobacteria bacterium]|jgi:hypothetical protein|nr:hypothetical protein [Gammaproteobacteria bacterium]
MQKARLIHPTSLRSSITFGTIFAVLSPTDLTNKSHYPCTVAGHHKGRVSYSQVFSIITRDTLHHFAVL